MKTKTRTSVDDAQDDRDIVEFRQAWKEPSGMSEELEARLRFERLIADLSLKFINLPANEVDSQIDDALRRVCQCLGLDLAALWQWSAESPGFLALTHLYRSLQGPPTPEPMDAQEYFPWYLHQLLAGKVTSVSSIEDLPAEAVRDKEMCRHFGIRSALTIPLSVGRGPLIGALSFNDMKKERLWPEALVERLQTVAQIFANAIARKRSDQVLEERLRFERLLTELSAKFINQTPDQIDGVIDESLKRLVEALGHDRSSLAQFSQDKGHALVTHSCAVSGIEPFPAGVVADDRLPWYVQEARKGKTLVLKCLPEDFPPEAAKERQVCITQGIKSTVAIPLRVGDSVLGIISFSFLKRYCEWSPDFISRLQIIGEVFANALVRKRSDEAIRAALTENEQLRERLELENVYLREQITLKHHHGRIIGKSRALKKVLSEAERVAGADTPVLLFGETGTGKELLAQTIHELSSRRERPMVTVNCASLPATLIESELFGREAGAYTGAVSAQVGRFEIADGSTLFLDEIGEFPIELQAKLLRVLQDGRFERLGSPESVTVNVRIIAATNRDLEQAMRDGKFRADLYHRLNVFPIHVPPLRERCEDISPLVWAFVEVFSRRMGKTINSIPRRTMEQFQQYSWPGNVRELSNVIERAMILTTGDSLLVEMPALGLGSQRSRMTLNEGMREQILRVLQDTGWRIRGAGGAAEILAIKPTTLESRMAKLGISRPRGVSDIS
jgi:transcriptional regulator with GAF, ATPase, and Fis domain